MNPGPAPPTWEPSANRITSQSLWVLHLQSGVNFVPVRTRSTICRTPTLLCDSQRCQQMATVLRCGRQEPLGTHGDSSSQGPRGSRPAVSSPRAAHTGPLERGPQSHRPPGRPTPQGGRGGRTRLRLARHGGLCSGPLGTVGHLGFQTPSPGCVSVRSLGQNVLICSMAFPPTSHWPCGSHPPGSVDMTSLRGGGEVREGPSCLQPPLPAA